MCVEDTFFVGVEGPVCFLWWAWCFVAVGEAPVVACVVVVVDAVVGVVAVVEAIVALWGVVVVREVVEGELMTMLVVWFSD